MDKQGEYVIVLADGTTYTGWRGCSVLWVPPGTDQEDGDMDHYVKHNIDELGIPISLTSIDPAIDHMHGDLFVPDPDNTDDS